MAKYKSLPRLRYMGLKRHRQLIELTALIQHVWRLRRHDVML
jgi:hypothetical protein